MLGKSIRLGRMQRRLTAQDLAERVGVSRSTLQRIEKGDPKVEIGLMFEAAAIVGVTLFETDHRRADHGGADHRGPDHEGIKSLAARTDDRIALLPRHVYKARKPVVDDF